MFNSIGPLKSVDLLNAIDYRIENLRGKLAKAAESSIDYVQITGISQEIVDAYAVRKAIKNNAIYVAVEGEESPGVIVSDSVNPTFPALLDVAERLANRYICNHGMESEFIACVTPSKETIGTSGVWDDWLFMKTLIVQIRQQQAGLEL